MGTISEVFEAIGTHWQIDVQTDLSEVEWKSVLSSVHARIEVYDKTYSRFRSDSLVTKIANDGGSYVLPPDAEKLLSVYRSLYSLTDGKFTPLIGNILSDSGYDATYSFSQKTLRTPSRWEDVIQYSYPKLTISQGEILDFGAGGKGYLLDIVGEVLSNSGINEFTLDAGGDILTKSNSNTSLRVGLEHPHNPEMAIGIATICNQSIAGSSGNRRSWGKFHHIFDPDLQNSTKDVLATWVIADTGLCADALATCLFFVHPEKLQSFGPFEYLILFPDLSIQRSAAFKAELFG